MSFLSREHFSDKEVSPFENSCLRQASYDLRLGCDVYVVGEPIPQILSDEEPYIILAPGQFALLTTLEVVTVPADRIAFITVRNTFKTQGLVNISGFHVDPTFSGRLKFAVQNVGPLDLRLKYRDMVFTIFFARLEGVSGESRKPGPTGIEVHDVQTLGGGSITLASLKKELDRVNMMLLIYAPFAAGAFVTLLVLLYRLIAGSPTAPAGR